MPLLETRVVRRIEEIAEADWNSVYPCECLEGYRFFRTLDDSHLEQFSLYYTMVYQDGKPVGAASFFLMSYSLDTTIQGPFKVFSALLRKMAPNILNLKTLMCGSPISPGRIGVAAQDAHVFEALHAAMEEIAQKEKVAIVAFKDFDTSCRSLFSGLAKQGFHRFESFPNTEKEIHYKDFDDYLKSLSYKTRYDLKRKFKKADESIKLDLEVTHDLGGALDEAYALYRQMGSRHEVSFETLPKEFFSNISKQMPHETRFFLWRNKGKLVAFSFCLVSGDYFLDFYLGLDYAVAYDYHLYFLRFRDLMKWCIENGIRRYEMGCTNYDPKKRLGFHLVELDVYAKMRNRWVNWFFGFFCHLLEPRNSDPALKEIYNPKKAAGTGAPLTWMMFLMIILTDVINGFAQILMKKGLPVDISISSLNDLKQLAAAGATSYLLWAGVLVYASNFFIWMIILSRVELVVAAILASAGYAIMPLMSMVFLHEKVSPLRWSGILLIMLGVALVSWNATEKKG